MSLITRYLTKKILWVNFCVGAIAIGIPCLGQSLRFLDSIVNRGMSAGEMFALLVLFFPRSFSGVIPLSAFFSTLFVYQRLQSSGELIAMRAMGLSPLTIAWPAIMMALLFTPVFFLVSLYTTPVTTALLQDKRSELRHQNSLFVFLEEGSFTSIAPGITVYFKKRLPQSGFQELFLLDQRKPERSVAYFATYGRAGLEDGLLTIAMEKGSRQEFSPQTLSTSSPSGLYFERFVLEMESKNEIARIRRVQEYSLKELWNQRSLPLVMRTIKPGEDASAPLQEYLRTRKQILTATDELYRRFITPLLFLFSTILAVGISLGSTQSRFSGKTLFPVAIASVVCLQLIPFFAKYLAIQYGMLLLSGLYTIPVGLALGAVGMFLTRWIRSSRALR